MFLFKIQNFLSYVGGDQKIELVSLENLQNNIHKCYLRIQNNNKFLKTEAYNFDINIKYEISFYRTKNSEIES